VSLRDPAIGVPVPESKVRRPAVAGTFYPDDPVDLCATVDRLLASVTAVETQRPAAAYLVPHAGYRYSGPTAAHVYARLRHHTDQVRRVVVIGPSHRVPLDGVAVTTMHIWRTPLGDLPVDTEAAGRLAAAGHADASDIPHAAEHAIEVQLPFLQRVFEAPVSVLPISIGRSTSEEVTSVLDAAVEPGDVLLCSSDLSHYLPDAVARQQDERTAKAISELDPDRIGNRDACGLFALRGLLGWARQHGYVPERLHLATSADTAGGPERVVGYSAFAFHY
jgi:AmmeMemoRadiSam system protein B